MAINLKKPTINGDKDDWGTKLNANIDKQNIQDTTLESKLGFDYEGTEATTGNFSLFNNAIQVDLDTDIITFGHSVDTPTLTTPVINGTITGTGVSSNGADDTLVKYGTNGLITCGSAGINTNLIAYTGTLNLGSNATVTDLEITGNLTGVDIGTTSVFILTSDLSWTVGSTGADFTTLQEALQEASKYKTTLKTGLSSTTTEKKSYTINITVEDGHIIDYWLFLEDTDLSFVNIIYAGTGRLMINTLSTTVSTLGFIYGKNSKLPNFTCDLWVETTATADTPLFYLENSSLFLKNVEIGGYLNNRSGGIKAFNSVVNLDSIRIIGDSYFYNCNILLKSSLLNYPRFYDSYCIGENLAVANLVIEGSYFKLDTITVNGRISIYKKSNVLLESLTQNYTTGGTGSDCCIKIEDSSSLYLNSLEQSITFSSQEDENIIVDNSELRINSATLTTGSNSYAITSLNGSVTSLVSVTGTKNIAVNTLTANGIIFSN